MYINDSLSIFAMKEGQLGKTLSLFSLAVVLMSLLALAAASFIITN